MTYYKDFPANPELSVKDKELDSWQACVKNSSPLNQTVTGYEVDMPTQLQTHQRAEQHKAPSSRMLSEPEITQACLEIKLGDPAVPQLSLVKHSWFRTNWSCAVVVLWYPSTSVAFPNGMMLSDGSVLDFLRFNFFFKSPCKASIMWGRF